MERRQRLFSSGHEGAVAFVELAHAVNFADLEVLRPDTSVGEGALGLQALEVDAAQGLRRGGRGAKGR